MERVDCPSSKSRRDDLFIEQPASKCFFFLFFSGAARCLRINQNASSAPLKNKKKQEPNALCIYKQVIPAGFQNIEPQPQTGVLESCNPKPPDFASGIVDA